MLGTTRSQERGVRSDKQHHESEGESRHARLRAPTSWEKVAIGGNTRSDANKGQRIEARLLQPRILRFGFLQDRNVGVGVFYCGLWSRCAKNRFWHALAADSNSLNSGVPRSFTSNGSVCKAV
jgi:hypothetical protein